ncbi:hypothetical protein BN439_2035 [Erwinia amylovora Ea644]|nr:hypothetical protein BN439_2035 [Erwinia amylovora Ea644]CCP07094.1 hypothetical protein BN440_2068 [Erwinia amylovora MR1]
MFYRLRKTSVYSLWGQNKPIAIYYRQQQPALLSYKSEL